MIASILFVGLRWNLHWNEVEALTIPANIITTRYYKKFKKKNYILLDFGFIFIFPVESLPFNHFDLCANTKYFFNSVDTFCWALFKLFYLGFECIGHKDSKWVKEVGYGEKERERARERVVRRGGGSSAILHMCIVHCTDNCTSQDNESSLCA